MFPEIWSKTPIAAKVARIELPPYDMNGRVIPVFGSNAKLTAMLINACPTIQVVNPTARSFVNSSGAFCAI